MAAVTPSLNEASLRFGPPIPVMRPRLPSVETLLPYLSRIDEAGWYTNHGPLAGELGIRLSEGFAGLPVVLSGSGTSAIIAAVLAKAGRAQVERPKVIIPDFTFAATGHAVEACGYDPLLFPVDRMSWQLDPDELLLSRDLDDVGLVVPVGAMGRPVSQQAWQDFEQLTGIPVVIDGAACFEELQRDPSRWLGDIPVAVSFHATKTFSTAEGGAVICRSERLAADVEAALNFGFRDSQQSMISATNGKLSEYHAAIGLASLDIWPETQESYRSVIGEYTKAFDEIDANGLFHLGRPNASCYVHLELDDAFAAEVMAKKLGDAGVESRRWYGTGLSSQPYFKSAHQSLDLRDVPTLLGLPMAIDLTTEEIDRVALAVAGAMESTSGSPS